MADTVIQPEVDANAGYVCLFASPYVLHTLVEAFRGTPSRVEVGGRLLECQTSGGVA